jgi:hypothetical protein
MMTVRVEVVSVEEAVINSNAARVSGPKYPVAGRLFASWNLTSAA